MQGAPKGNNFAKGNKGGKPYSKENREKVAKVRGMTLDYILSALKGKDEILKKEIVLKIATTCIPTEITGEGGEAIKIVFDNSLKAIK
jgi:hypothetical protein